MKDSYADLVLGESKKRKEDAKMLTGTLSLNRKKKLNDKQLAARAVDKALYEIEVIRDFVPLQIGILHDIDTLIREKIPSASKTMVRKALYRHTSKNKYYLALCKDNYRYGVLKLVSGIIDDKTKELAMLRIELKKEAGK